MVCSSSTNFLLGQFGRTDFTVALYALTSHYLSAYVLQVQKLETLLNTNKGS